MLIFKFIVSGVCIMFFNVIHFLAISLSFLPLIRYLDLLSLGNFLLIINMCHLYNLLYGILFLSNNTM